MLPQLRDVEGVGEAAHIKDQVRLLGQPVFEAEGDALGNHPLGGAGKEGLHHPLPQLGGGEQAGIKDNIRLLAGLFQQLSLLGDGVLDGKGVPLQQGVAPPPLLVPAQEGFVIGV